MLKLLIYHGSRNSNPPIFGFSVYRYELSSPKQIWDGIYDSHDNSIMITKNIAISIKDSGKLPLGSLEAFAEAVSPIMQDENVGCVFELVKDEWRKIGGAKTVIDNKHASNACEAMFMSD